jgi:Zn-dependent protease
LNFEAALINVSLLWLLTTPHEFAHAWTAIRLGDDTPLREGRVTLNPMAHVDWVGTLILPGVMSLLGAGFIGWGRPVNTNPSRLRGGLNGMAIVALAGPASNVVFALILAAVSAAATASGVPALSNYAAQGTFLSLYLAIFNLLPVPPLDGSRLLLAARVPMFIYRELAQFGFLLLIAAMVATDLGYWMSNGAFGGARFFLGLFG